MAGRRVLALSSSRVKNSGYLEEAVPLLKNFLGNLPLTIAFIPFADAANQYDNYHAKVANALSNLPYTIRVAKSENARSVIEQADVIMVGGGNTFKLLHDLYQHELMNTISQHVHKGLPYVGWSAGSNIAGLSIGTTNDMPIIQPQSFKALEFFPFQINPHYVNVKPEGYNGETRDERLAEYLMVNPQASIVGLPEGAALQLEGPSLKLAGQVPAVLFKSEASSSNPRRISISPGTDLAGYFSW